MRVPHVKIECNILKKFLTKHYLLAVAICELLVTLSWVALTLHSTTVSRTGHNQLALMLTFYFRGIIAKRKTVRVAHLTHFVRALNMELPHL